MLKETQGHQTGTAKQGSPAARPKQTGQKRTLQLTDNPRFVLDASNWPGGKQLTGLRTEIANALEKESRKKKGLTQETINSKIGDWRAFLAWVVTHNNHASTKEQIKAFADITASTPQQFVFATSYKPATRQELLRNVRVGLEEAGALQRKNDPIRAAFREQETAAQQERNRQPKVEKDGLTFQQVKVIQDRARRGIKGLYNAHKWWLDLLYPDNPTTLTKLQRQQAAVLRKILDHHTHNPDITTAEMQLFRHCTVGDACTVPTRFAGADDHAHGPKTVRHFERWVRTRLFLTSAELDMMGVYLCIMGHGWNKSVVSTLELPESTTDGRQEFEALKLRRSDATRQWEHHVPDKKHTAIVKMIMALTQPARDSLAARHTPSEPTATNRLLIRQGGPVGDLQLGLPAQLASADKDRRWATTSAFVKKSRWTIPDLFDYPMLRLAAPGGPVEGPSVGHTADTHEEFYLPKNAEAVAELQQHAGEDITAGREQYKNKFLARQPQLHNKKADETVQATFLGGCVDPGHHPDTGDPCETGFRDFLLCIFCPFSRSTQETLPNRIAARDALDELRDGRMDPAAWEEFAPYWDALTDIVNRNTAAEIRAATEKITPNMREMFRSMLKKDLDVLLTNTKDAS